MQEGADSPARHCASCGATLTGPWCAACGERTRKPGEVSLREYLGEWIEALTNLEGRFWGSLRTLVIRPGQLTLDYMAGRRVRWMRPLHLFLLFNLLYFLLSSAGTFNTPLYAHMMTDFFPHQSAVLDWSNRRVNDPPMDDEAWRTLLGDVRTDTPAPDETQRLARERLANLAQEFDRRTDLYARTLVILLVPMMVLWPLLLSLRKRMSPVFHLVFVSHWTAGFLLVVSVGESLAIGLIALGAITPEDSGGWASIAVLAALLLWTPPAFRRVYGYGWPGAVLASVGMLAWLVLALQAYRTLLFFLVRAAIG
jgi:hypothetical protein